MKIKGKEDVKEAVRLLKEEVRKIWMKSIEDSTTRFYLGLINKEIDKIFGDKLI